MAGPFKVTLMDWPGFGAASRLAVHYSPPLYHAFLRDFVRARYGRPVTVLAARHAAGYVVTVGGGRGRVVASGGIGCPNLAWPPGRDGRGRSRSEMDALTYSCATPPLIVPGSLDVNEVLFY